MRVPPHACDPTARSEPSSHACASKKRPAPRARTPRKARGSLACWQSVQKGPASPPAVCRRGHASSRPSSCAKRAGRNRAAARRKAAARWARPSPTAPCSHSVSFSCRWRLTTRWWRRRPECNSTRRRSATARRWRRRRRSRSGSNFSSRHSRPTPSSPQCGSRRAVFSSRRVRTACEPTTRSTRASGSSLTGRSADEPVPRSVQGRAAAVPPRTRRRLAGRVDVGGRAHGCHGRSPPRPRRL